MKKPNTNQLESDITEFINRLAKRHDHIGLRAKQLRARINKYHQTRIKTV